MNQTMAHVGPGSYIGVKSGRPATIGTNTTTASNKHSNNLHFGTDKRFKPSLKSLEQPGPGNYNDSNKWNKRTYNLKFLNFKNSQNPTKASSMSGHKKS